jgi:single-strand DNA-binding protein
MAGEIYFPLVGNLTNDPELRFVPNGDAVANFTIAATPRTFDRNSNSWRDGETAFLRCNAWRELAENICETLTKGMAVVAYGKLKPRTYQTKDGENRTVFEYEVENIGPSLKSATAKVAKRQRGEGGNTQPAASAGGSGGGWGEGWGNDNDAPF